MADEEKTSSKRREHHLNGAIDGKPFTSDNQPSPQAKKAGWEQWRAKRMLTQKIVEKLTGGKKMDEYVDALFDLAKDGNAKAIETINKGIEDQVQQIELNDVSDKQQFIELPNGTKIPL
mgnify:CR=1 FL=1